MVSQLCANATHQYLFISLPLVARNARRCKEKSINIDSISKWPMIWHFSIEPHHTLQYWRAIIRTCIFWLLFAFYSSIITSEIALRLMADLHSESETTFCVLIRISSPIFVWQVPNCVNYNLISVSSSRAAECILNLCMHACYAIIVAYVNTLATNDCRIWPFENQWKKHYDNIKTGKSHS